MSLKTAITLVAALPATAFAATPAPVPEVLTGGPWNLHYAEDSCRLAREFGTGPEMVTLRFEWFGQDDRFDVLLIGNRFANTAPSTPLDLQFGPEAIQSSEADFVIRGTMPDGTPFVIVGGQRLDNASGMANGSTKKPEVLPPVTPAQAAAVREVQIRIGKDQTILRIGSMAQPMTAIRTCIDQLLAQWGLNPDEQRNLATFPTPIHPERWITTNDYPSAALRARQQTIMHFRVLVDAQGKPTDCIIQSQTLASGFGTTTCANVMAKARFEPARRADGTPAASYYVSSIRYVLPS